LFQVWGILPGIGSQLGWTVRQCAEKFRTSATLPAAAGAAARVARRFAWGHQGRPFVRPQSELLTQLVIEGLLFAALIVDRQHLLESLNPFRRNPH
jgi:hypothetical protein